jgi:hypothetical protein
VGAGSPGGGVIQFAVSTYHHWSNAVQNEFDVYVDVNGDGVADYDLVMGDFGGITAGSVDGRAVSALFNLRTGGGFLEYFSDAPTDSSTAVLTADLADFTDPGHPETTLSTTNPRITYWVKSFGLTDGTSDATTSKGRFNPFNPAVSTSMFDVLAPNGTATETLTVNAAEQALSPALGWLVLSHENPSGRDEAQAIGLKGDN